MDSTPTRVINRAKLLDENLERTEVRQLAEIAEKQARAAKALNAQVEEANKQAKSEKERAERRDVLARDFQAKAKEEVEKAAKLQLQYDELKKKALAAGVKAADMPDEKEKKKKAESESDSESFLNPSNGSNVVRHFLYIAIVFAVLAVIGVIIASVAFPTLFAPMITALLLWIALLFVWLFVMHFANKALWTKSETTVRFLAAIPFITAAILAVVFIVAVYQTYEGTGAVVYGCYPNTDATKSPVPLYDPDHVANSAPVDGWEFDYTTGTCKQTS
jgi:cation transport ATPase